MEENACSFLFEVDDKKVPSQVTGTMHVAIPADASKKELKQIQNVLQKSIAQELGLQDPEDIEVTIDPKTGIVTYKAKVDDPGLAEKDLQTDDFLLNVNKAIDQNSKNLPKHIRENLEIDDVNVNYFFYPQTKKYQIPTFLILVQLAKNKIGVHQYSQK